MIRAIKNFLFYKNTLNKHRATLLKNYGVHIDMIYRMYTVYTISETDYLQYGEQLLESDYKSYKKRLDGYLIKNGLSEMYGIYLEDRPNERQYRLGLRYKHIDTLLWANILTIAFVSLFVGLGLGLIVSLIF